MPIYEYRCDQGHTFEVMQRMSDEPLVSCETCDAPVQRVFHPVAVHFKGSGFYNTDYGTRKRARENAESKDEGSKRSESKSDSKSDSKPEKSESKSDSKSGSKSDSKSAAAA
jgi:putative FmdB family regulatory protein